MRSKQDRAAGNSVYFYSLLLFAEHIHNSVLTGATLRHYIIVLVDSFYYYCIS